MLAKLFAIGAYVIGLAGAVVYIGYVFLAGNGLWPREPAAASYSAYATNGGLLMLFAVQHSGMQRRNFWRMPAHLERSAYVGASGIVVGLMTLLWRPIPGDMI